MVTRVPTRPRARALVVARPQPDALRALLAALAAAAALLAGQGCEGCADPGDGGDDGQGTACVLDADCGPGSLCMDGRCAASLPIDPAGGGDDGPSGAGIVKVTPTGPVDFGSPSLGVAIERRISVLNMGQGVFDVTAVENAPGTSAEYAATVEGGLPMPLAPGDAVDVVVRYTLADGDDDTGAIVIRTTAAACDGGCDPAAIQVALTSEFKGERNLLLAPAAHDFGFTAQGGASAAQTLVVKNDGTLQKVLTVASIEATGDVDQFDYELPSTPLYLAPGETVGVVVTHRPTDMDDHAITFTATANSDAPDRQELSAVFVATSLPEQALAFDPPQLLFSTLAIGQSEQRTSRLVNLGGRAVEVTSLPLSPPSSEYEVFAALALPFTIPPGGDVDVFVDYSSSTGQPSTTSARALNDQENGQVPVLAVRGESYVPPGGPNVEMITGPEDNAVTDGCACQATGDVPAANVDLQYRVLPTGPACVKAPNPACGINGGTCDCDLGAYGDATWSSARTETVRGETWIVDEKIVHATPGQDGSFAVRVDLLDDCLAVPGSTSYSANYGCCFAVDCETAGGNDPARACYPYDAYPHCATACEYFASSATSQDCLQRGPIVTRTSVRIYGGATDETRAFCTTMATSGSTKNVVTLARTNGYFTIASVDPSAVEVAPGEACPAP